MSDLFSTAAERETHEAHMALKALLPQGVLLGEDLIAEHRVERCSNGWVIDPGAPYRIEKDENGVVNMCWRAGLSRPSDPLQIVLF